MKLQKFSGNWLTIWVHLTRQFQLQGSTQTNEETVETFFASWHLKNLTRFWISSTLFGYGMYFFFGIAFHVRQFIFKRFSLFSWTSLTKNNRILRKKSKKKKIGHVWNTDHRKYFQCTSYIEGIFFSNKNMIIHWMDICVLGQKYSLSPKFFSLWIATHIFVIFILFRARIDFDS